MVLDTNDTWLCFIQGQVSWESIKVASVGKWLGFMIGWLAHNRIREKGRKGKGIRETIQPYSWVSSRWGHLAVHYHVCLRQALWNWNCAHSSVHSVISGINTTSDISKLLYVVSRSVRRVKFKTILKCHKWYLCQISRTNHAIICLYYYPQKVVIFACRYFKLSWNTTALSQSVCRNFSCSSIKGIIEFHIQFWLKKPTLFLK